MDRSQRIIELRQMFLELAEIILVDLKKNKSKDELEITIEVMQNISTQLEKLEKERLGENPANRNSSQ